ncbi:hypothetical protein H5410_005270 [Solanum commersonii]|uniref:Uncharacterized protein n=1 Tax=Solanum commersonii TaxID=4109 RepID=A0A9J6A741_SOLCO|nr:hypothetical protein H5410_005270 [Solanum commersonii]
MKRKIDLRLPISQCNFNFQIFCQLQRDNKMTATIICFAICGNQPPLKKCNYENNMHTTHRQHNRLKYNI